SPPLSGRFRLTGPRTGALPKAFRIPEPAQSPAGGPAAAPSPVESVATKAIRVTGGVWGGARGTAPAATAGDRRSGTDGPDFARRGQGGSSGHRGQPRAVPQKPAAPPCRVRGRLE